jgi:antitoxin component of MazEF toxin-antitoxin module
MITKFEPRKIRAMNYTHMVSIPKVWLRSNDLDTGDQVSLEMQEDGSLIIRPLREDHAEDV